MSVQQTGQICNTIVSWLNATGSENPKWSLDEWNRFKFVCRVHGVAPLLHTKLKTSPWLNDDMQQWLVEQYHFNQQRIAKMHGELTKILALFAANNIPLMPLKGSILSTKYYDDPVCRPMADLDLLIRPDDFESAAALLNQLGYQPDVAHWKHTEFSRPDNRRVVSVECEHPDNPRKLEIHRRCRETFGGPTIDLTQLMWDNAVRGKLLGQPASLPTPEALWLHLLVHATYHLWQGKGRLIHLVDLALLTSQLDKPGTMLNSIGPRFTYPALAMLNEYFPDVIADSLLSSQRQQLSPSFQQWADGLDLVNSSHLNPDPVGLYLPKALKFTEGRPREIAQALRFAMLPGLDEIALDHPRLANSKIPWLAYFLLPVDWVKRLQRPDERHQNQAKEQEQN